MAESYDYLYDWLLHKSTEDVIILQELHWGCGREEVPGPFRVGLSMFQLIRGSAIAVLVSSYLTK